MLSAEILSAIHHLPGGRGPWGTALPDIIARCASRWSLTIGLPFPQLSYNLVLSARDASGRDCVLKLGQINRELRTEIDALRLYDGRGSVQLLAAAEEDGALLLERLHPGQPLVALSTHDDESATHVATDVMQALWRPVPFTHAFPAVADWGMGFARLRARFDGGSGPLPGDLLATAETVFDDLVRDSAESVLLHGDLHHTNILSARRAPWLAIDPKGVVGEPAYEAGAFLRNPLTGFFDRPDVTARLQRRVAIFHERLGVEPQRLLSWAFAQAVLSAVWSVEDSEHWQFAISCATLFLRILRAPS